MNEELDRDLLQIDALLRRAANGFPYPPTPDIASRVRARLNEPHPSRWAGIWQRPAFATSGLLAALAVAAVIALSAAVAVPTSRSALADFFGLSHISFLNDDASSPTPPVLAPGNFARPSTLDEVRALAGFPVRLPDGEPDAVYIQGEAFDAPIAIFVFEDYDLYETREAYIQKLIGGNDVTELTFDGHVAYWVEQGGHIVQFLDDQGRVVIETRRTVDRATLIWEEGGITYRIETSRSQADTVAVAQSLR